MKAIYVIISSPLFIVFCLLIFFRGSVSADDIYLSRISSLQVLSKKSAAEKLSLNFSLKQKKFIKNLYNDKKYFDCIGETERLLMYSPESVNFCDYNYFIESLYYLGGQYKSAIKHYNKIYIQKGDFCPEHFLRNSLLLSQTYFKLGLFSKSYKVLDSVSVKDLSPSVRYDFIMRKLEPVFQNFKYSDALAEIRKNWDLVTEKDKLADLENDIKKYRDIDRKSKTLSVLLSALVPGSGQFYSGKYLSGILSLAGVVATAAGSLFFYKKNEKGISYGMAFFSVLFYSGNIYGAYNSAAEYNFISNNSFRDRLTDKHIPVYKPVDKNLSKSLFN